MEREDLQREIRELRQEIKELKREMKESGVRLVSCFNGGLTNEEQRCNSKLFRLKVELGEKR